MDCWKKEVTNQPTAFSVAASGQLFVIVQSKNILELYHSGHSATRSIGGQGLGNYEFDNPTDVSSSFLLDVYVTDFNNRRIQRYDKNLNYVQTYDEHTLPPEIGRFQPRASAFSSRGDLFVVELDGKRIVKLDKRSRLVGEFGTFNDGAGALTEPTDIAISSADEIYVLDRSKIITYDLFGNYLRTITLPAAEWKNIQVSSTALTVTASDRIIIQYFDSDVQTTITRSSIIGVSSGESFVDAVLQGDHFTLLTTTALYYCTVVR
ncbi:MAG: NHL repeat-containing protein [Ignavibacteriales bacterium]|nr:NHL repeat-containing protein [Ignavibacteriales bacterium]